MAHTSTMQSLGLTAPSFNLPNFNRGIKKEKVSLEHFEENHALLVAFICNHCPYVVHIRDSFISFVSEFQKRGLGVVAINSNDIESYPEDGPEKMTEEAAKYSYPFPYLFDENQDIAKAYKAACTPDFFLYDTNRSLVYRGQYDSSRPKSSELVTGKDLRNATNALIQGSKISEEQKPSMGCNIKWKIGEEPVYFKSQTVK